jgi:hypothetical protein
LTSRFLPSASSQIARRSRLPAPPPSKSVPRMSLGSPTPILWFLITLPAMRFPYPILWAGDATLLHVISYPHRPVTRGARCRSTRPRSSSPALARPRWTKTARLPCRTGSQTRSHSLGDSLLTP